MRQRKRVDYRDFDPEQGPITTFSDEDDFEPGSEPELEDDIEMEDLVSSEEEEIKEEQEDTAPLPPSPSPPKQKRDTRMDHVPRSKVSPPPPPPKLDLSPPITLKVPEEKAPPVIKRDRGTAEKIGDRFRFFMGFNEDYLVEAIETRVKWGPVALIPEQSIADTKRKFSPDFEPERRELSPLVCELEPAGEPVGEPAGKPAFTGHPLTVNEHTLAPGAALKTENVCLINAGSFVKAVSWAPFSPRRLLAVATVASDQHPLDCCASDPLLSIHAPATGQAKLQFYLDLEPFAAINCGGYGHIIKMEWRPVAESTELAVLFQNGKIAIVPAPTSGSHTLKITRTISLDTRITSFCWGSADTLICGTMDGYVAEFELSSTQIPTLYHPLHLSLIHDISASIGSPLKTVCTTSPDGDTKVTDLDSLSKSIPIIRGRSFLPNTRYLRLTNSYVTQDDHTVSRLLLAHTPSMPSATQLTMHEGSISALATSLLHPFVLSGSTDGTLCIVNAARRAFMPRRNLKDEKSVVLWKLQCNERTKAYTITETLKTSVFQAKVKTPAQLTMSPQTCTITAIDWAQSRENVNWYCAATAGGLLRIEKLD